MTIWKRLSGQNYIYLTAAVCAKRRYAKCSMGPRKRNREEASLGRSDDVKGRAEDNKGGTQGQEFR